MTVPEHKLVYRPRWYLLIGGVLLWTSLGLIVWLLVGVFS